MINKIIFKFCIHFCNYSSTLAQKAEDFSIKLLAPIQNWNKIALNTRKWRTLKFPSEYKLHPRWKKIGTGPGKRISKQEQKIKEQQNQEAQQEKEKSQANNKKVKTAKNWEDKAKESQKGDPSEKAKDPASENAEWSNGCKSSWIVKRPWRIKEKLKAMNSHPEQQLNLGEHYAAELSYIHKIRKSLRTPKEESWL